MNEPRPQPVVRTSPRWNRIISLKALGIILGVGVLMFVVGYLLAVRVLFPPLAEPKDGIVVPSLIGLRVERAEDQLRRLGLRLTEVSELEHPTEPVGTIIAQSPLAGQQLRELGAVRLAISAGPGRIEVPLPPPPVDSLAPLPDTIPLDTIAPDTIPADTAVSFYLK